MFEFSKFQEVQVLYFFLLVNFMQVQFTYNVRQIFLVQSWISYDKCITPCNHYPSQDMHFHHTGKFLLDICNQSPLILVTREPLNYFLSLQVSFNCSERHLRKSHKDIVFIFVYVFFQHVFKIYSCCYQQLIILQLGICHFNKYATIILIHFPIHGHLDYFQFLVNINKVAINVKAHELLWV